jgi:hypothetical protein
MQPDNETINNIKNTKEEVNALIFIIIIHFIN